MNRILALACAVVLFPGWWPPVESAIAASQAAPAGAADTWLARSTRMAFQPWTSPDAPVRLDVPQKDWMVLPASGPIVFVMASRKGDAVVLVERATLRQALEPGDITDLFAQIEADAIRERHPKAADFELKVLDLGARRLVAVQYGRPGVLGPERVRQYSVPVGQQLYRLTCISRAAQFAVFGQVFSHVAASFTVTN